MQVFSQNEQQKLLKIIILNLKIESNPTRNMAKFHCLIKHGCRLSVQEKTAQITSNRLLLQVRPMTS